MEIKIDELKEVFSKLIETLDFMGVKSVELTEDYYFHILNWTKVENADEPAIGSLFDDWSELQKNRFRDMIIVSPVDFDRFSSIIRFVGDSVFSS